MLCECATKPRVPNEFIKNEFIKKFSFYSLNVILPSRRDSRLLLESISGNDWSVWLGKFWLTKTVICENLFVGKCFRWGAQDGWGSLSSIHYCMSFNPQSLSQKFSEAIFEDSRPFFLFLFHFFRHILKTYGSRNRSWEMYFRVKFSKVLFVLGNWSQSTNTHTSIYSNLVAIFSPRLKIVMDAQTSNSFCQTPKRCLDKNLVSPQTY